MPSILSAAASGMTQNQNKLDAVSQNMANVETFAYKKIRPLHEGLPTPEVDPEGTRLGVAQTTTDLVFSQAITQLTDNPMNFAIEDDSFLRMQDYDGRIVYTRVGALGTDGAGNVLVLGDHLLEPPLQTSGFWTQHEVDSDGIVTALDTNGERQEIGRLSFAKFRNPQGLEIIGGGMYSDSANTGEITVGAAGTEGFAALRPGGLEGSNVDTAEEFTTMIIAQRAYSACAKTFGIGDEMLAIATNITQ